MLDEQKVFSELINYYESVPEDKWCIKERVNELGQNCAFGLITPENNPDWPKHIDLLEVVEATYRKPKLVYIDDEDFNQTNMLAAANNGELLDFQQETPKERSIAYLKTLMKN